MQQNFDNRNLLDKVYLYLKEMIIKNELQQGSRINYDGLSYELGISKTPLRDAINKLEGDGLIEIKSRSGTFVRKIEQKDVKDIYDVRRALELLAVELCIKEFDVDEVNTMLNEMEQIDKEIEEGRFVNFFESDRNFHRSIINWSNNDLLINTMNRLEAQVRRLTVLTTINNKRPIHSNKQHKEILKSILNKDITNAKRVMEAHIKEAMFYVLSDLGFNLYEG